MIFRFLSLIFVMSFTFSAQAMPPECKEADSTSSIQACLKNQLESSQQRLNVVYEKILEGYKEQEQKQELIDLQKTWLDYRDQECMWEAKQASNPALKSVNELSCMATVTKNRALLLETAYQEITTDEPRQYISSERWENLLANDYNYIFWNIEDSQEFDLACNDENEIIVMGERYLEGEWESKIPDDSNESSEEDSENEDTLPKSFAKNLALAVIQNPPLGKPSVDLFELPVFNEQTDEGVCATPITLKFEKLEQDGEDSESEDGKEKPEEVASCETKIILNQRGCDPREITLIDNKFVLNDRPDEAISDDNQSQEKSN
ncbi:MAG: lysozyme inhibitor LprI family protein [Pseudomonadota bacterium]